MQIWQTILIGLVQGFTEFLPVSSSGHIYLLTNILGIPTTGGEYMTISVFFHLCTLVPVVIVLWKEIIGLFKKPFKKFTYLILATIPAGIVGVVYTVVGGDEMFGDNYLYFLSCFFLVTAVIMFITEKLAKKKNPQGELSYKTSLIMGAFQAFGTLPGISRSGSVLTGGTIAGLNNKENASFCFLMSIPLILGSALVEGIDVVQNGFGNILVVPMLIGGVVAMISGYVAVKFMLNIIRKANYKYFSAYLVVLATVVIILKATAVL